MFVSNTIKQEQTIRLKYQSDDPAGKSNGYSRREREWKNHINKIIIGLLPDG